MKVHRWWNPFDWHRRRKAEELNRLLAFNAWIDATAPDPELADLAKMENAGYPQDWRTLLCQSGNHARCRSGPEACLCECHE